MSATQVPDNGIPHVTPGTMPSTAPKVTKEWAPGVGEVETREWKGTKADIEVLYGEAKEAATAGTSPIANLTFTNDVGRASLIARYATQGSEVIEGVPSEVTIIEELYAVDVVKDIVLAPIFRTHVDNWLTGVYGVAPDPDYFTTNDQIAWVRFCCEERYSEAEITTAGTLNGKPGWSEWTLGMKELRNHIMHGQDSYYETAFVLRRSAYGVRSSAVEASFVNINRVVEAPTFSTSMQHLIEALPDGEWLYKPPQAESLGRGRWRVTREWHWADQWSIVYGGSFHL